jgi:oligopeptide transport system substrate-binding protein
MTFSRTPAFMRAATALALLAASALFICGCARKTQVERAANDGILLMGNKVEPSTLDPQLTSSVEEGNIQRAIFEGLIGPNPANLSPEPALAESWDISPDGLRYTFHIRKNACWSDGEPITSNDFMFSWKRLLSPELAASNAQLVYCIKGAKDFNEGKNKDFSSVGISAPDAQTLVVNLNNPTPWFLSILMYPTTYPVPRRTIESCGDALDRSNAWTHSPKLVTSGPFTVAEWRTNSVLVVKKNPRYWDAAKVRLNAIRFFPIENLNIEETAFRGGQLHVTDSVPVNKIAFFSKRKDPALHIAPYLGIYYYAFNVKHPPLDNPDVRRALSLAIDRDAITQKLLSGTQTTAKSFVPKGIGSYAPPETVGFDLVKARELLSKAGYPEGKGFPKLEILYNTSDTHRTIAEAVQAMWKQNLGIDIALRNEDFNSYVATRSSRNYDIIRATWIADYPTQFSFLEILKSDSGNNHAQWKNAAFDAEIAKAMTAAGDAERNAACEKAESLALDEAAIAPIYHLSNTRLISPYLHGWEANLMDWHPYKYMWLEAPAKK